MNINFELYRIFYTVAVCGNITKASKELMISQPAVTKQLKTLESQLGGELFIRTKKGVILTDNGREIFNYVKHAIVCFQNAEMQFANLKNLEKGTIRIGVSTTLAKLYLIDYLKEFHKQHPNIGIEISTDPSKLMRNKLRDGRLDIVIAKFYDEEANDLETIELGTLHDCFISSNEYSELKDKVVNFEELDKYPILLQRYPSTSRESLDNLCHKHNIELTTKMEIGSANLLEEFVKIGLGVGFVTKEFVKKDLESGELFEVKTTPKLNEKKFGIILLKDSMHSFGTNQLVKLLKENKNKEF
ncbi:MAG: LysR family transcriptional regulator [Bacilli bacterium]|nr:LysR family transcriptional regulator [Bacilli bacterium]